MYVLYTDESGEATNPADKVTVVAGVAVHEDAVRPLAGAVNGILRRYVGKNQADQFEIHGSPLRCVDGRNGRGSAEASVSRLLIRFSTPFVRGSTKGPRHRSCRSSSSSTARTRRRPSKWRMQSCCSVSTRLLRKMRRDGNGHNGILVADRGKYECAPLPPGSRSRGAWKRVPKQENGVFTHLSRRPSLLIRALHGSMQLADLVSFSFFRSYNFGDSSWSERLDARDDRGSRPSPASGGHGQLRLWGLCPERPKSG